MLMKHYLSPLCSAVWWYLEEDAEPLLGVLTDLQPMTSLSDGLCCRTARNVFYPYLFVFLVSMDVPGISEQTARLVWDCTTSAYEKIFVGSKVTI